MSLELGTEDDFWRKTPRQIAVHFDAAADRYIREHNDRWRMAWWNAALPYQRHFPKMDRFLLKDAAAKPRQTSADQWAIFAAMAEASKAMRKH